MGSLRPRKWLLLALGAWAAVYCMLVYRDRRPAERMEENAEKITLDLPMGTRVVATIFEPPDYRMVALHVVDRACVGHCFLYSNYEASTKQFRLRVREGSPVVVVSLDDGDDMQSGLYEVRDHHLPSKALYQSTAKAWTKLCVRDLKAGEKNGTREIRPE